MGIKTNILKEKPKFVYSVALVLAFLSAENENRQQEDLLLADLDRLPEGLHLSVRTKSINENFFELKITTIFVFVVMIQRIFHLKSQYQRTLRLLFEDCRLIYFHSLMKSAFLPNKGLLCLYDNKIIHGCLKIWNFSSRVQLDISLVRRALQHSKRNSISRRAHVLFSILNAQHSRNS